MKFLSALRARISRLSPFDILMILFVTVLIWSAVFKVDKTVNVSGVVEPKGRVIAIQNRFDSKISTVDVTTGQLVMEGSVLFRLDPEDDTEGLQELEHTVATLSIQLRRLTSQVNLSMSLPTLPSDQPQMIEQERQQLFFEITAYKNEILSLETESELLDREIKAAMVKITTKTNLVDFLQQKLEVTKKLYEKKYEGKLAYLEAKQQHSNAIGDLLVAEEDLEKLGAEKLLIAKNIEQVKLNFKRDTTAEIATVKNELEIAKLQLKTLTKRVGEFSVTAPVDGTISKVFFTNRGEVVPTGSTLAELIPVGRPLIFTGKVRPEDILEMRVGQTAKVMLSNMDARVDPPLSAFVANVEANSRTEENGERFFFAEIEFEDLAPKNLLRPGVDGSAGILLGKRSVIEYVLDPIFTSFQGALSE